VAPNKNHMSTQGGGTCNQAPQQATRTSQTSTNVWTRGNAPHPLV